MITVDFETYSDLSLKECGLDRYSKHPSTDIICMSIRGENGSILWTPGKELHKEFVRLVREGEMLAAWNAQFEFVIWNRVCVPKYGFPRTAPEQWHCSMTNALIVGLPGSLDKAARVMELPDRKDADGHRIMLRICKPDKKGVRVTEQDKPEYYAATYNYCTQDTLVERSIDKILGDNFQQDEYDIYDLTRRINARGLPIDVGFVVAASAYVEQANRDAVVELAAITDGQVTAPTQVARITEFVNKRGVPLPNLTADIVSSLVAWEGCEPVARRVLEIRQQCANAAVQKYDACLRQVSRDGRLRYQLKHHGATTGRWSGTGVQIQNLKRPEGEITEEWIESVRRREWEDPNPIPQLAVAVRSMVCAKPGRMIVDEDFSQVECRTLGWLAGDKELLAAFGSADPYVGLASEIYGVPAESIGKKSQERFVAKTALLGLGFGMGPTGFANSVRAAGVDFTDEQARSVVDVYRGRYQGVVALWRHMERAVKMCVAHRKKIHADKWTMEMDGNFLRMTLPSGRQIAYYKPFIGDGKYGDAVIYHSTKGVRELSMPVLVENLTQATARDLLANAMLRMDDEGLIIVATVHDSILVEALEHEAEATHKQMLEIMHEPPRWAKGLPLGAEGYFAKRMR